jgi:hypothetical protein
MVKAHLETRMNKLFLTLALFALIPTLSFSSEDGLITEVQDLKYSYKYNELILEEIEEIKSDDCFFDLRIGDFSHFSSKKYVFFLYLSLELPEGKIDSDRTEIPNFQFDISLSKRNLLSSTPYNRKELTIKDVQYTQITFKLRKERISSEHPLYRQSYIQILFNAHDYKMKKAKLFLQSERLTRTSDDLIKVHSEFSAGNFCLNQD